MVRNYLIVALRNLMRHKGYSMINITGLAVGMACCVLIGLFIQDEFKVDGFHSKGGRIFRLVREMRLDNAAVNMGFGTSGAAGPALKQDYGEVEAYIRFMSWGGIWTQYEDKKFGVRFGLTDPNFLEMFDFELVIGDRQTVLSEPLSILVTESTAKRFFGDADPVGKVLSVDDRYYGGEYTITGVLKDVPRYSTLRFDVLCATQTTEWTQRPFTNWAIHSTFRPANNYILLKEGVDAKALERKLPNFIERYMGADLVEKNTYYLQPLERIYLYSKVDYNIPYYSDITYVYLFATIGVFLLLIACINFMNLATARSARRAREVGLRKVVGAYRRQLIGQFLGESLVMALLAAILSTVLVYLSLPDLNDCVQKEIVLTGKTLGYALGGLAVLTLVVGVLAGGYPALFLSGFRPVSVLKGSVAAGVRSGRLRQILVVFQFAISTFLIAGTYTVYQQLNFVRNKNLGFDKELIVMTPVFVTDRRLTDRYLDVKHEFLQHPNILKASASHSSMGYGGQLDRVYPEGKGAENWQMRVLGVDEAFLDTYELELVAGRDFSLDVRTDSSMAYILNETAVKRLGWKDPIGKSFGWLLDLANPRKMGQVVGVVKDFHNRSLHEEIRPVAIAMWQPKFNVLALKIRGKDIEKTIQYIGEVWRRHIPEKSFSYRFLDEDLDSFYQAEQRMGTLATVFAGLAIVVACLGLFGLAAFTAEQRTKEIGIRKTLGASVPSVIRLLSYEFVKLVLLANLIAFPAAFWAMRAWLDGFAYRIDLGVLIFLLSGLVTLAIALLTVSTQAWRAALVDPVTALRYE
ncbi:MAG: ABC transporter permease [bacterium]|nr:ABC transporter permease [bacterium]